MAYAGRYRIVFQRPLICRRRCNKIPLLGLVVPSEDLKTGNLCCLLRHYVPCKGYGSAFGIFGGRCGCRERNGGKHAVSHDLHKAGCPKLYGARLRRIFRKVQHQNKIGKAACGLKLSGALTEQRINSFFVLRCIKHNGVWEKDAFDFPAFPRRIAIVVHARKKDRIRRVSSCRVYGGNPPFRKLLTGN